MPSSSGEGWREGKRGGVGLVVSSMAEAEQNPLISGLLQFRSMLFKCQLYIKAPDNQQQKNNNSVEWWSKPWKQIPHRKRYTNGLIEYENVLNITGHQGNAN